MYTARKSVARSATAIKSIKSVADVKNTEKTTTYIRLSDASDHYRDKHIDDKKGWAETLASTLERTSHTKAAARVRDCANVLFFGLHCDEKTGELKHKLRSAPFCHNRHCPLCNWRRAMKNKATILSAMPALLNEYKTARFIFLTLTVKNCELSELRRNLHDMNKGWQRLIKRKDWPALGWIRTTEITRGKDGTAHPHFHCLLMVKSSYFKSGQYIKTTEWVKKWREALRLSYEPVCHVCSIKSKDGTKDALASAVAEVVKYATTTEDMTKGGAAWLEEYINQVYKLRFIASGGVLKSILKDVRKGEDEDLVHVDESGEENGEEQDTIVYSWNKKVIRKNGKAGAYVRPRC